MRHGYVDIGQISLLPNMRHESVELHTINLSTAINAYASTSEWTSALNLRKHENLPESYFYACTVDSETPADRLATSLCNSIFAESRVQLSVEERIKELLHQLRRIVLLDDPRDVFSFLDDVYHNLMLAYDEP